MRLSTDAVTGPLVDASRSASVCATRTSMGTSSPDGASSSASGVVATSADPSVGCSTGVVSPSTSAFSVTTGSPRRDERPTASPSSASAAAAGVSTSGSAISVALRRPDVRPPVRFAFAPPDVAPARPPRTERGSGSSGTSTPSSRS